MATPEFDIAQLTEGQQLALQQYVAVTDQNLDAAVPLLQRCEWNLQIAIARFFDGEPIQPIEETLPPPAARRQGVLLDTLPQRPRTRQSLEAAPRIVAQPENASNRQAPVILSLLFTPINIIYGLFAKALRVFSYLFPFLPRILSRLTSQRAPRRPRHTTGGRHPLNALDTTSRFLREFEEEYGTHTLPLLETSYARAYDQAKQEVKFLLVIPLSPEHDDTPSFVRSTLLSPPVLAYLTSPSSNVLLWAGTVADSEAYQVAAELALAPFPSAALIAPIPDAGTPMSVLTRIAPPASLSAHLFLAHLEASITQHAPALTALRATRAEQTASRTLREQQNSAYERSLATDRARAQARRDAEAAALRAERRARELAAAAEKRAGDTAAWRRWRAARVLPEPGPEVKDAVRIGIRLLDGRRVARRFEAEVRLEEVYAFVECFDLLTAAADEGEKGEKEKENEKPSGFEHRYAFRLVAPMPREVFDVDGTGSVKERIGRSGSLVVEKVGAEDDEEQDE